MREQNSNHLQTLYRHLVFFFAAVPLLLSTGCIVESPTPLLTERQFSKAPVISGYFYSDPEIVLIKPVNEQVIMYATSKEKQVYELRFIRFPQSDIFIVQALSRDPQTNTVSVYRYFGAYIPADGSGFKRLLIDRDKTNYLSQRFGLRTVQGSLTLAPPLAPASFDVIEYFFEVHARMGWENVKSVDFQRVSDQTAEGILARQATDDQQRQADKERNTRPRYDDGRRAEPRPRQ